MEQENIQELIERCLQETSKASLEKYDSDQADKTAALFLVAQMRLSSVIEEVELQARMSKNEIERLEAEKYFECKNENVDKKITESALTNYVAKDKDVVETKNNSSKFESKLKKMNYIMGILKDGHIFFRNIGKNKNWQE